MTSNKQLQRTGTGPRVRAAVVVSGPAGLRLIRGYNDEDLSGDWNGHRSSRLNEQYRAIYRVERSEVRVEVVSVTPHDYRRK